jgi:large subunit GTPase 1
MIYGIEMPKSKEDEDPSKPLSAERLCAVYSLSRGYMNHRGMPDVNRGSRYILKDYVNGKLLYCYPPPHIEDADSFQEHRYEPSKEIIYLERLRKLQKKIEEKEKKPSVSQFDKEFFLSMQPKALTKGGIVGYHRNKQQAVPRGADIGGVNGGMVSGKASKKHFNAHKREKLRRKTSHFDAYDF